MKTCTTCGEEKQLEDYRLHRNSCKSCENKKTAASPSRHTDAYREYQREHKRQHRKTTVGREVYRKSNDKYNKSNPEKRTAWSQAHRAVPLAGLCEMCQDRLAEVRHHDDYEKPKCVSLLCRRCHKSLDNICLSVGHRRESWKRSQTTHLSE